MYTINIFFTILILDTSYFPAGNTYAGTGETFTSTNTGNNVGFEFGGTGNLGSNWGNTGVSSFVSNLFVGMLAILAIKQVIEVSTIPWLIFIDIVNPKICVFEHVSTLFKSGTDQLIKTFS